MESRYFAVINEKLVIDKGSIEAVNSITEPLLYIFKQIWDNKVNWGNGDYHQYTYVSIDKNGNFKPIDLNYFTIVDIGAEKAYYRKIDRKIVIKEKLTGQIKEFSTNKVGIHFFIEELLPLFCKLNKVVSFEMLDKYDKFDAIQEENENLKRTIEDLKKKLEDAIQTAQ